MANELIINVTLSETRVARLENGVVAELSIDRIREEGVLGNISKGKVVRVLPGMQAAFVEIGLSRTAFLHAADVLAEGESDHEEAEEGEEKPSSRRRSSDRHIEHLLREGNEILVQVEKEPMGTKGARLTSHISLPGRYLVYMPTVDHIGASRRIENIEERTRLKDLIHKLHQGSGGFIIRTAAEGATDQEIAADIRFLTSLWQEIERNAKTLKAPALVRRELSVLERVVRDQMTPDIDRIVVDSAEARNQMLRFIEEYMPSERHDIELYQGHEPLFDAFGIEIEINRALGQKVWLKSGGYIIIEQTEALTAIDVNTGRFVGRHDVEDTILKTNLEAVKEIVYQLRLRNIGGIIILDFIDMQRMGNRTKVYNALKETLRSDRARSTITKISEIGLVEMTRKRTREDLRRQLTNPCLYCEGKGYLKSTITVCYELFREILREAQDIKEKQILVACHPTVADLLYDEEREHLEEIERKLDRRIVIKSIADYHLEQFDVAGKSA